MSQDPKYLFDKRIPEALAAHPDKLRDLMTVFCVNITGPGGGVWTLDFKNRPASCTPGKKLADVTLTVAADDFKLLVANPSVVGMQLYFRGKLAVEGNPLLLSKLNPLFLLIS